MTSSDDQDSLEAALLRIAARVEIRAADRFDFDAQPVVHVPGAPASLYPTAHPLVGLLRDRLYASVFVRRDEDAPLPATPPAIEQFAQRLSEANASRERWDEGWRIEQPLAGGQVLAARHDKSRTLWPGEFVLRDGTAMALRAEAPIGVFQPRESRTMQAGFYFAFGETVADQDDEARLLRLYWNVSAAGALALLPRLTKALNRFAVPFKFKCLDAAEHYVRLDAAVLYVNRRFHPIVRELAGEIAAALGPQELGRDTPLFTHRLGDGLALAEDPTSGESFGMHRCRIVAEGLWSAFCDRCTTAAERVERIRRQFELHGLSLARPHLNAGSAWDYT
jgi:hypothetical protein